ncbi:MAG: neutral/alkaline non-lysosomal ceramidase N-terminal domain-containing protein, partial [Mycobacteriales bacterium]
AVTAAGHGIRAVQLSGLANEYLSYFTSPQEYDAQHYEGGSTMYGRTSSVLVMQQLQVLTQDLLAGRAAPAPDGEDPTNGVAATAAPFPTGATSATAGSQPRTTQRLQRATFGWTGGVRGFDMPLGRAFVSVERLGHGTATDDQGLQVLWRVDDKGAYTAEWEVPRDAPVGRYRFVVTGNHYRLVSQPFQVTVATTLSVQGHAVRYPDPVVNVDLTARPALADGAVLRTSGTTVAPGGASDRYGNCNGAAATTDGTRSGADASASPSVCPQAASPARRVTVARAAGAGLPATGATPALAALALLLAGAGLVVRRLRQE